VLLIHNLVLFYLEIVSLGII